ncbi:hypothetical protein BaRGS_00029633 [Batillaria attramentaria]|uniref:Uncharacterized protein n=1 Tax=Batillaria attramentaria TaxID=370345 RepID=A0ABD0JWV0_9CAEN
MMLRLCSASLCEMAETLLEYAGQRNTTSDGTPCVHWQDPDTNHTVASYRKEDFPGGDMRHNYCRNPGHSQSSLWCYTNKSGSSYGHCSVPQCPTGLLHFHESDEAIPSLEYCYNPEIHGPSSFNQTREALQKFCNDTVLASCYTGSYMAAVSIVCDVCGPPPKVARMKSPDGVYRANDSATYTCDDDFYPISDGPTTITCRSDLTWTDLPEKSLRCEQKKNVSGEGDTNPATLNELTDDNVTSCVDLTSGMYNLHLGRRVEVGMLTLHFDNGSLSLPHSMSATVVMETGAPKNCSEVNISTLTTMTCPQYPVGKEVQILIESDDSSHFRLCEWRVFGRNRDTAANPLECLQSENGLDYKGDLNFTRTGRTCLRWDAAPTILSADLFPDASLADVGNKCRNPIGYVRDGPWCFINNTDADWELCVIRQCSEWCYFNGGLFDYAGTVNSTGDRACLAWPNDTDKGLIRAQDFSDNSMDHNFCRNPDRSEIQPWCYVNDPCKKRVTCAELNSCGVNVMTIKGFAPSVTECYNPSTRSITTFNTSETAYKEECLSVMQSAVTATCFGNDTLSGNPVAVNIECETCLYPRPVPGLFVDGSRPYEVGSNALYRCPRGQVIGNITCVAAGHWSEVNFTLSDCYGTCPPPPDLPRLTAPNVLYKAGQSVTYTCRDGLYPIGGDTTVTCIWDEAQNASDWSNIPEEGDHFTSGQLQDLVDDDVSSCVEVASGNYTLMVKTRLEVEAMSLHFNLSAESILGSVHVDVLKNQSAKFCGETSDLNNITYITCTRAPVGNGVRIQLSHDSGDSANFSLCEIRVFGRRFRAASKDALQCLRSPRGLAYKGGMNFTWSGRTCLRWDSPDTTNISASKFPDATIRQAGNKCRNPSDVRRGPWCFVNTTHPKWEYCHVPLCGESDGETDHNYCRNPDRSESGPWCFTSANETENCSVSECATTISFHHEVLKPAVEACYNPATNQMSSFSESRAAYQAICPTIPNLNVTTFCYLNTSAADNSTRIDMVAILMRCDEKRKKKYPLIPCDCNVAKNLKELTPQKAQERAEQFKKDLQLDAKTLAKAKRRKISAKNMKAAHKYCLGMESRTDTLRRIASGRRRRRRENQGQVSVIEEQSPGNDDAAQASVLNKDETADNMSITRRRVQKPGPSAAPREDARPSGLPAWASIEEPGPSRPRDDLNQDPFPHARIPPSIVPGRPRPDGNSYDSSDDSSDDGPMMCRARASLQQKPKTTTVVVDLEMLPRRTQLREQTTPDSPEEPESYI